MIMMDQQYHQEITQTFGTNYTKMQNKPLICNKSNSFINNNSYGHKPFHRKYHKISNFSPDQAFIIKYLNQRGYHQTSNLFQQQIANLQLSSNNPQKPILFINEAIQQLFSIEKMTNLGQIQSFFQKVQINRFLQQKQVLRVKFLIYIWATTRLEGYASTQHRRNLQKFIQLNGDSLAENEQLLPYFALSYIQSPIQHPFLGEIYKQGWRINVRKLIQQAFKASTDLALEVQQNKQQQYKQQNAQIQWYLFFKDLVQISSNICQKFQNLHKIQDTKLLSMIRRIRQYKNVLQNSEQFIRQKQNTQKQNERIESQNLKGQMNKISEARQKFCTKQQVRNRMESVINRKKVQRTISDTSKSDLSRTSKFIQQLEGILQKQGKLVFMGKQKHQDMVVSTINDAFDLQIDSLNLTTIKQVFVYSINQHQNSQAAKQDAINVMDNLRKLLSLLQNSKRKQLVLSLIEVDFLCMRGSDGCLNNDQTLVPNRLNTNTTNQNILLVGLGSSCEQLLISFLLFLNKLCSFYICRNYILQKSMNIILPICNGILMSIVIKNFSKNSFQPPKSELYLYNNNSNRQSPQKHNLKEPEQKVLDSTLALLLKLSVRQQVAISLARAGIIRSLQLLVQNYQFLEQQTFTYCMALIMHLFLSQSSRALCASFSIFHSICMILTVLSSVEKPESEQFEQIQSYMHSIIYLLMNQKHFRERALQDNLPDLLAQNMIRKNNQFYTKQVQYIISKIIGNQRSVSCAIDGQDDAANDRQQDQQGQEQHIERVNSISPKKTPAQIYTHLVHLVTNYSQDSQTAFYNKKNQKPSLIKQKIKIKTPLLAVYCKENYLWRNKDISIN